MRGRHLHPRLGRLAAVIDLDSCRAVGCATADHLRTELVADALRTALAQHRPEPGVVFGPTAAASTPPPSPTRSPTQGVRLSVGRKGQCRDNTVAESFFAISKAELLDRRDWPARAAAHKAVFETSKAASAPPATKQPRVT
ncbi:hypothetical protein [Amycolatopsis rubida]|uniref:hypothetical protein n=1 Tax=Amycolatopsis rubida TaxID=112413 RepID=UPI000ABD1978|nr:hypothetical protein [Amycolatopsis rubida]